MLQRSKRINALVLLGISGVAALTGWGAAQLRESEQDDLQEPLNATAQWRFPSNGLSDWVTYAEHIAVVSVTEEQRLPSSAIAETGSGHVGRIAVLSVQTVLWSAPGVEALPPLIEMLDWGWIASGGRIRPLSAAQLDTGGTFLVPLTRVDGRWVSVTPSEVALQRDRFGADLSLADPWVQAFAGRELSGFVAALESTDPDPAAAPFAHLEPESRAAAVAAAGRASEREFVQLEQELANLRELLRSATDPAEIASAQRAIELREAMLAGIESSRP